MSRVDPFARLAPFIQAYIYRHGWTDLRDIQKAAIPAILDTPDHILIMSGTASGKTEAALLPALTLLDQSPAHSVGVLYVGPLKALINDQFERLQELLQEHPEIPLQGWHGDIAQYQKKRFLQNPRGILQITPESMEALLMNRSGELRRIFGDLRFIIIDEIHAFLGTERGQQVLCHVQRLERAIHRPVRRIGLSATIGDEKLALQWLESSRQFQLPARLVTEPTQGRQIELRVSHFVMAPEASSFQAAMAPIEVETSQESVSDNQAGSESKDEDPAIYVPDKRWELQQKSQDYYDDLFTMTMRSQKTLIFTNRRYKAERIAAELRQRLAQKQPGIDWYFVHHSSISADLREAAEAKMRNAEQQACTIATASLELGIDIGHLDLTVQIDAPHTVSSFVQRLGRSGRRGTPSRMCFYTFEYLNKDPQASPSLLQRIPWNFLQTIAIIQLYLEERWIEPPNTITMPWSLLYQQTMSILRAQIELTPARLAEAIFTLSPFQAISLDEYRLFLRHLVALDQLATMEEGTLIVGMKGEQLTKHYHFYAIFANEQEYRVFAGTQEIGTTQQTPDIDSTIGLAGYAWRVISVDERGRTIHVERAKGVVQPNWLFTGTIQYHQRVMLRLRQVLQEETMYPYLSHSAQQSLTLTRNLVKQAGWLDSCIAPLESGHFVLLLWTGSRVRTTLAHILRHIGWYIVVHQSGCAIEVVYSGSAADVLTALRDLSPQVPTLVRTLVSKLADGQLWQGKYDHLVPRSLLEKAYINDVLDVPGTAHWLATCS